MKKILSIAVAAFAAVLSADVISEKSPDGRNEIRLSIAESATITVLRDGVVRLAPTPVSMTIEGKGVFPGKKVKATDRIPHSGTIATPIYKKASIADNGNETRVTFEDGWQVYLHARNDGVAYRFGTEWQEKSVTVMDEAAGLVFPSKDLTVYAGLTCSLQSSWESIYTKTTVGGIGKESAKICYLPLLVQYPDGVNMCVTESDLRNYPGWNLTADVSNPSCLKASFARFPDPAKIENDQRHRKIGGRLPYMASTKGTRTYPWRVFVLADAPAKLMESDIVYALATPCALTDGLGWIKPGKVAWEWWNCWNVFGPGVDFKAGCNTATYRHYIDFASETGVEYVIMDEGWSMKLKIMEINPDVDVEGLCRYAESKGVGIILWCSWPQLVNRQHEVFQKYAGMGVKGFKIDFMDRDDQFVVDFVEKTAAIAAQYRLVVDYHGMFKPTGLSRTYPNILNYEGVHGLEMEKFNKSFDMPGNDLKVFFTRMTAGQMDYTPGAMRCRAVDFSRNFDPQTAVFTPNYSQPDVQGTRVHQMALMSLYEAPLQMLCDSPTLYRRNMECFRFMAAVPVTWDESIGLVGDVDRVAAAARRKGDTWYVSAIAGWSGAETEIDTSFLGDGEWSAEIFEDGPNANRAPEDYVCRQVTVNAGEKLNVRMAPGGGWTARVSRPKGWAEKLKFWK